MSSHWTPAPLKGSRHSTSGLSALKTAMTLRRCDPGLGFAFDPLVAKTATAKEGNWAGFWGADVVLQHLDDLYKAGPFRIDPDYDKEKVVALSRDVAETYVPVDITVAYAGQVPVPKPFLMILEWVRTRDGWRMATDIALPIPPASSDQAK